MDKFWNPINEKPRKKTKLKSVTYDTRSGNNVSVGDSYGVGYKNPVGNLSKPTEFIPSLPYGRVKVSGDETE